MDKTELVQLFAALLAIMNPLTVVPVFVALTEGYGVRGRRNVAVVVAGTVFATLALVLVTGTRILQVFGITLDDFRVAGGILIFIMSLALLRATPSRMRQLPEETSDAQEHDNPAFFPLAIPMMAGPGSMTTVILFGDDVSGGAGTVAALAVIAAVCGIILITLLMANWIARE
ncbi:MAG: MarC family protein, partial [Paracoccaceae bacterium]